MIVKYLLILFVVLPFNSPAQYFKTNREFREIVPLSLCGGSLEFDTNGYFFIERGCEGNSNVAYGTYFIKKDKVYLRYLQYDSLQLINHIEYGSGNPMDSLVSVQMFDRYHNRIAPFNIEYYAENSHIEYFNEELLHVPKNGAFILNKLNQLLKIKADSTIQIPVTDKPMKIYFNLPGAYFAYGSYNELPEGGKPQLLYLKKDGLYTDRRTQLFKSSEK